MEVCRLSGDECAVEGFIFLFVHGTVDVIRITLAPTGSVKGFCHVDGVTVHNGSGCIEEGQLFTLTSEDIAGTKEKVSTTYKALPSQVEKGTRNEVRKKQVNYVFYRIIKALRLDRKFYGM